MNRNNVEESRTILADRKAIITGSHFVYAEPKGRGHHGDAYVNKDAVYPDVEAVSRLCREMALRLDATMKFSIIDVVVGLEKGGIILSQWLAHWLNEEYPPAEGDEKTLAVYAEKKEGGGFELRRGYDRIVKDKNVILVEDVLNSGGSAKDGVAAIRNAGGEVLGVIAICNRGSVTAESLDVPFLDALISISDFKKYPEDECPICKEGVIPIRTDLGHGAGFLKRRSCAAV